MTDRGPGGRIPNQGNPPAAKGIGKNAKRHDLETPSTPGLADSDLQQGDVGMLEQGQRTAPIKRQANAVPQRGQRPPEGKRSKIVSENPSTGDIITSRLGGTLPLTGNQGVPDPQKQGLQNAWVSMFNSLSKHPHMSPLLKARMQTTVRQVQEAGPRTEGNIYDLFDADNAIDAYLTEQGF